MRTFTCVNCDKYAPFSEIVAEKFSYQHRMTNYDVEVKICTECYMSGGLSKKRKDEIVRELADANEGARW